MVFFAQKKYGTCSIWISLRGHNGSHRFAVVGPLGGHHVKTWGMWDAAASVGHQWRYFDSRSEAMDAAAGHAHLILGGS